MKRIGILSDTHAWWDDRYVTYFSGCDEIWHAGDIGSEEVLDRLAGIAPVVRAVCGNIDGGTLRRRLKEVECFTTEGVKVWMTHIGGYPGRYAPGVKAALLAPTAVNQQKFHFEYVGFDGDGKKPKVIARKGASLVGYTQMDLGIAKCHFEIGAGKDNFDWLQ